MADQEGATPEPTPEKIQIGEQEFSVEELTEAIDAKQHFTQKSQDFAAERREWETALNERLTDLEQREAQFVGDPSENGAGEAPPAWASKLGARVDAIAEAAEAKDRENETVNAINSQLAAYSTKPGYDRDAILRTMQAYGWDDPAMVDAAHRIVSGPIVGQKLGEQAAIARGANAPPVMGSEGYNMATPFGNTAEAGAPVDYSNVSYDDLEKMALNDPNAPR